VRFFDNISYVVTFERTDPFYVLNLEDPMSPVVLGELEVPGFSEFMHPVTDDNSLLITIGQDTNDDGVILGLSVSLFDSKDPTNPKLIDRLVIENNDSWSGSSAVWDERAFRYLKEGNLGRLIVPVSIYPNNWDQSGNPIGRDFDGFMVFGVDLSKTEDIITKEFEIDHTGRRSYGAWEESTNECFCYSYLPERSMVFNGNLMTIKNQRVVSTALVTKEMQWNVTLEEFLQCCY
jgi:hypothetical protein